MQPLTVEDWQKLKAVLDEAADLPTAAQQPFLEQYFSGQPHLLAMAQQLLAKHESDEKEALPSRLRWQFEEPGEDDRIGSRIGPYIIRECLGEGGMGVVYSAERQLEGAVQPVALKILKRGLDTQAIVDRFHRERQILARLDHPYIANFLDGGETQDHLPYLVMTLVQGQTLFAYCRNAKPSLRERLLLFRKICQALHYAHQNLIVHRDLKPNNLLITQEGDPRLLDFGIAKVLCPDSGTSPPFTREGHRLLTPEYASPEQIRGESPNTASDIYSLGILFYELISGLKPFEVRHPLHHISTTDWLKPSQNLSRSLAEGLDTQTILGDDFSELSVVQVKRRIKQLRGDLDLIARKAMHPDPERRYSSAMQMAADIDRHLAGKPILAGPDTFRYVFAKWLTRHKLAVSFSAVTALLITGFTLFSLRQHQHLQTQQQMIASEQDKSRHISRFMSEIFAAAEPFDGDLCDATATMLIQQTAHKLADHPYLSPKMKAALMETIPAIYQDPGLSLNPKDLLYQSLASLAEPGDQTFNNAGVIHHILAHYQLKKGSLQQAEKGFRQAQKHYASSHQTQVGDMADLESSLGEIARKHGHHQQAKLHQEKALSHLSQDSQASAGEKAKIYKRLGAALSRTGSLLEAVTAYENAMAVLETHDDYSAARAEIQTDLGLAYRNLGQHEKAVQIFKHAIALRSQRFGKDSPWTAKMYQQLAWTYVQQGSFAESEAAFTACYNIRKQTMAPSNPELFEAQRNLAGNHILLGKYSEAVALLRGIANNPGFEPSDLCHENQTQLFMYQAQAHLGNQEWDAAEASLEQALSIQQWRAQTNALNEGQLFLLQGRLASGRENWDHAELYLQQSISLFDTIFGPASLQVGRAYMQLAATYHQKSDPEKAIENGHRALSIFSQEAPHHRPFLGDCLVLLAQIAEAQKDQAKAREFYKDAYPFLAKSYGKDSPKLNQIVLTGPR